ncbi:MAG TPA: ribosome silencing factor [Terriglobales bacterium]
MKQDEIRAQVAIAVRACIEKKAEDISILRLDAQASGFTDYFVICSAANPRQVQAIGDEVDMKLSKLGYEPSHVEGRNQAEWLLLDYVDFVVHIFSESVRKFYDLERLWKTATRLQLSDLEKPAPKKAVVAAKRVVVKKTATKKRPTPSTSSGQAFSHKKGKGGAPGARKTTAVKRTVVKRTKKGS